MKLEKVNQTVLSMMHDQMILKYMMEQLDGDIKLSQEKILLVELQRIKQMNCLIMIYQ